MSDDARTAMAEAAPPLLPGQVLCGDHGGQWAYNRETKKPDPQGVCGECLKQIVNGELSECPDHGLQPTTDGECPVCKILGGPVEAGDPSSPPEFDASQRDLEADGVEQRGGEQQKPGDGNGPPPFDSGPAGGHHQGAEGGSDGGDLQGDGPTEPAKAAEAKPPAPAGPAKGGPKPRPKAKGSGKGKK